MQSKWKIVQQQKAAEQFMREHRALWTKAETFVDYEDLSVVGLMVCEEADPEYLAMCEEAGESLEDMLAGVDYDSAPTESQSAVTSKFYSLF